MHETPQHHEVIASLEFLVIMDCDAGTVFSGQPSGKLVKNYVTCSPFTPATDNNYIFHEQSRDIVVWFLGNNDPLYVYGRTGCGKSSVIK